MRGNHISIPPDLVRQCTRCGALGTHYLTCPSLRLPPGTGSARAPPPDACVACQPTGAECAPGCGWAGGPNSRPGSAPSTAGSKTALLPCPGRP